MNKTNISKLTALAVLLGALSGGAVQAHAATGEVTLIHLADIHGHLVEHPNVRSDGNGKMMGGLARMYTLVKQIRAKHPGSTITVNGGDTVQGSAEAMFTQGEALLTVLNEFGIDVDNPGNWDYVYGSDTFLKQFAGKDARFHANTIAANLYYDGAPYAARTGDRVLEPYWMKKINGLNVGFIGLTASRGPQAVKTEITRGLKLTNGEAEFEQFLHVVRDIKKADVVVVISELGLAPNLALAERFPGVDVVLSTDSHETSPRAARTRSGTWVIETGQDGQVLSEMTLRKRHGKVEMVKYKQHPVTMNIKPDARIAEIVAKVRAPFVTGPEFVPGRFVNPFNGVALERPIDRVVGYTEVALHRSNFSDEDMPAVIEGSSHDFLTDAFRAVAGTEVGVIRGFRYGTHITPGPIKAEDLYHYIPIGPVIAKGSVTGHQLRKLVEDSAAACLSADVLRDWTGGWVAGLSGVTLDFNPYGGKLHYSSNFKVGDKLINDKQRYSVAGYFYKEDPQEINRMSAKDVQPLTDEAGQPMDAVAVVEKYLASLPAQTVTTAGLSLHRFNLVRKLPAPAYGNKEIQPVNGVPVEGVAQP